MTFTDCTLVQMHPSSTPYNRQHASCHCIDCMLDILGISNLVSECLNNFYKRSYLYLNLAPPWQTFCNVNKLHPSTVATAPWLLGNLPQDRPHHQTMFFWATGCAKQSLAQPRTACFLAATDLSSTCQPSCDNIKKYWWLRKSYTYLAYLIDFKKCTRV